MFCNTWDLCNVIEICLCFIPERLPQGGDNALLPSFAYKHIHGPEVVVALFCSELTQYDIKEEKDTVTLDYCPICIKNRAELHHIQLERHETTINNDECLATVV